MDRLGAALCGSFFGSSATTRAGTAPADRTNPQKTAPHIERQERFCALHSYSELPRGSVAALAAAFGAATVDGLYLMIIHGQGAGELERSRVIFVGACLTAAALLAALGGLLALGPLRVALLGITGFMLVCWTILGALSIGVLLLPALLALWSARQAARTLDRWKAWVITACVAVGDVAVVALGLVKTS
jgi:hypothetical protein